MQKLPTKLRIVYITIIIIVCVASASKILIAPKKAYSAQGVLRQINFQGKLTNPDGTNVADGNYSIVFNIYSVASAGSPIWTESWTGGNQVAVKAGIFRVNLGSITTLPGSVNFNTDSIYLGITVGADSEMTPRVRFTSVPQAFNSEMVNGLTVQNTSNAPFSTTTTLKIADGKTVVINNGLTFTGTDGNTITFPNANDTVVELAQTQTLTNKTVGSTGLTFSGATTDITTVINEDLSIVPNGSGKVNINTTSGLASVDIRANSVAGGTLAVASVSGTTSFAAFLVDNRGVGDIFTASTGGVAKFTVTNSGIIKTSNYTQAQGVLYGDTTGTINQVVAPGGSGLCLVSGASVPTWTSCPGGGGGNNWWTINTVQGTLYPGNLTTDFLLGGNATLSAKFAVLNVAGGTPTASVSAGASGAIYMTANGTIQTTANQTLNIGGSTTGNVNIQNGSFASSINLLSASGASGNQSGSNINVTAGNGFGTLGNGGEIAITGGSGTTSGSGGNITITSGATGGGVSGNLTLAVGNPGAGSSGSLILTPNGGQLKITGFNCTTFTNGGKLTTDVSGNVSCSNDTSGAGGGNNWWTLGSATGVLYPGNLTTDFLIGGISTASADFAILNVNGPAAPVASVAGTFSLGSTAGTVRTIGSTAKNSLQIGDGNTGNIILSGRGGANDGLVFNGYNCSGNQNGGKLTVNSSGVVSCGDDTSGAGGGGNNWWTLDPSSGVLYPGNLTAGLLIGGNSTASASFAFGSADGVATATFSGNLVVNARPNSSLAQQQTWTKISGTAGTIGDNATTNIASVSASILYNGSLYVGTATNNGQAEVYRYNGPAVGTWLKVSQSTAGQIASGGTSGIASVSAMTVFDGYLYVGTSKQSNQGNNSGAEVYRYDGGTNWTKVTQANAGTIRSGGTTDIDGVSSLAVFGGRMYAGTREPAKAELYRYDGGTAWTVVNTTAGTFVATNSIAINAITSMVTSNGFLYMGTAKVGDADVIRWSGGQGAANTNFLSMNAAGATGSYNINGTASTAFSEVTAMTTYNGSLIIGINKNGASTAEVLSLNVGPQSGTTSPDSWQRLGVAAGQINTGGTSAIDAIGALAVYGGRLYVGTSEPGNAEIYRYDGIGRWTEISQTTSGQIASGGTSAIYGVTILLPDDALYAMTSTYNTGKAEVYKYQVYLDQSYSLTFRATPGLVGGVLNNQLQEGSIFFLASSSAIANNKAGTNGAFAFSNSIITRNGAYDVAEDYPTRDDTLDPGDLISIDTNERGLVRKSEGLKDTAIIGVFSENPALRLSQNDGTLGNYKVIPVALAGRVPLKVSTENGVIKSGDYLTSSSVPGVAMKATKAGVTVARAMAPYDAEGVGKITVYVSSNSYNGTTADLLANIDQAKPNFEQDILTKLSQNNVDGLISEINTDTLVAGLEIITPKIVTDTGVFNYISIKEATISGTLTAEVIRANKIEGLEFIIGDAMTPAAEVSDFRFKVLDSRVASISARIEKLENLPQVNFTSMATNSGELFATASNLMVLGTTTLSDLSVISNFSVGNSLSISGSSINVIGSDLSIQPLKQGNINLFDGLITFDTDGNIFTSGSAKFAGDVTVGGVLSAQTAKFEDINLKHSDVKIVSDTEVEASGSSGLVALKAGNNNLKIDNIQAKKKSLIFVTPKTEVGLPLYIKEQNDGWFTIGIKENQNFNVDFNFLIIN